MNSLISIIVPVYNASNYLDECINSIINQTYRNLELIFINDGSTDNSLEILERYKNIDSRIIIINQENKGVSIARNNGMAIATGSYMGFVDADDWIEIDMFQTLFETIEKFQCDMVLSDKRTFINGKEINSSYNFPLNVKIEIDYIKNTILPYLIEKDDLYSLWNKLFKTSIIIENNIIFPPGNALSEDNIFNLLYFDKIKSMIYIDYTGYNYREVFGSATRNVIKNNYFQNVLSIYKFDYRSFMDLNLTDKEINKLKSLKFIKNILSLIYIYLNPANKLNLIKRIQFVKLMVYNEDVQNAINENFVYFSQNESKYNRFLIKSIKQKSIFKLFLATSYSRIRSK